MEDELCDTKLSLAIYGTRETMKPHLTFPPFPFLKKEKAEEEEEERQDKLQSSKNKKEDHDEDHGTIRKKLRLTNEQSTTLERSFYSHNNLNSFQKEELAHKLGLRPRQVEVWFQNRRARTKLKQTEVDCELLKRWCEKLTDENRRLRLELSELRFYGPKIEAKRVCPSCEIVTAEEEEKKARPVLQLCS